MLRRIALAGLLGAALAGAAPARADERLWELFSEGQFAVQLRGYFDARDRQGQPDPSAFAAGARVFGETAPLHGLSAGAALYASNDLGTRHADPARVHRGVPDEVDILGEAYLSWRARGARLSGGRILLDTPFANPADAFMVPITFSGVGLTHGGPKGLALSAYYLTGVKDRSSDRFADIGEFVGRRLVGPRLNSDSAAPRDATAIAGAVYSDPQGKLSAWGYVFADAFATAYAEAGREFRARAGVTPYLAAQYVEQFEVGGARLGAVEGRGGGVKLGARFAGAELSVAYNRAAQRSRALRGGAVLAPFSYATGALFTNSMVDTLENSDAGDALKLALVYEWSPSLVGRVSHAVYDRQVLRATRETDADLLWRLGGRAQGLSLRLRIGWVHSRERARRVVDLRTQLQYAF